MSDVVKGNIVSIEEAKRDAKYGKNATAYVRDYEGGTIVVDWENGILGSDKKPNVRFINAVQRAAQGGAEILVVYGNGDQDECKRVCDALFNGDATYTDDTMFEDSLEIWSTKARQFDGKGFRADGANVNGAFVTVIIDVDENNRVEVTTKEPAVTVASEQVVSLGMYLSRVIQEGMKAMTGGLDAPEKMTLASESIKEKGE